MIHINYKTKKGKISILNLYLCWFLVYKKNILKLEINVYLKNGCIVFIINFPVIYIYIQYTIQQTTHITQTYYS